MRTRISTRTLCLTGVGLAALFASPALAQDPGEVTEVEEIVVTGSRIAIRPENAPQPVQVLGAETLAAQGVTEVADALDVIPALQSSESTAQANGGSVQLNLRGMGANRTLVLVNGRRHVSGQPGTAAVDISTIPSALVERVEVLTGGASAVYGSDAVTGVVNFIMKRDFTGTEWEVQGGVSGQGDTEEIFASFAQGRDFDNGRGNISIGVQASRSEALYYGDRDWAANNNVADDKANPARSFQVGDPVPTGQTQATVLGRTILLASGAPRYANTDPALIARAQAAPARAYLNNPVFSIASIGGLIGYDPYGFGFAGGPSDFGALNRPDLDGNGTFDCLQSQGGRGGGGGFPVGCWVVDPITNAIRPFRDGLIGNFTEQFGGDGSPQTFSNQSLLPKDEAVNLNLLLNYEFSDSFRTYADLKYAWNRGTTYNPYNTFDDSIPIALDNPYIPTAIRNIVNAQIAQGNGNASSLVTIGRDNIDLFDPEASSERETIRAVLGFGGEIFGGWSYDVSLNYGETSQETRGFVRLEDRFFAAVDAVRAPNGDIVCRSTLNAAAFPRYSYLTDTANFGPGATIQQFGGFTTFTPGANSPCRPINLFGVGQSSQAGLDFLRYEAVDTSEIDQLVIAASLVGDFERWFSLPGGPVGFAVGAEYREENSLFTPDIARQNGDVFQYQTTNITEGGFDVAEAFLELQFPILSGAPFAEVLSLNIAGRIGDYSTVGETSTYKADAIWAPVQDIRFRGGYAVAIRAPNIGELFAPLNAATFRPVDPCDSVNVNAGPNPANRLANCRADLGITAAVYNFTDPLTARFTGQTGGNPNLQEEEAETITYGVVLQPRFLPDLSITADYWSIEIENAISAVGAQDIVNSCYDAPTLNNQFCALFTRNRNASSPTFRGFNYLLQTQLNFARLETSGIDFAVNYGFDFADFGRDAWGTLDLSVTGTYLEDRNDFPFVSNPTQANPVKLEQNFPEWAGSFAARWQVSDFTVSWFSNYQSEQTLVSTPIEDIARFAPAFADEFWSHNASIRWDFKEGYSATFGVNNITDEEPYLGNVATPVSPVGRAFFLRISGRY
ncbi:TonB-dependent receptor domain-containing protein [Brevundimonas bacteroides]|uniref:TonB-dependent receptor domain-containing protein n=1 Tax=Brevundimonas bacteroides TaxID=74311 RepID=UPI000550F9B1|nr:TonB-dependent receptor [Brevundimonas bacteroides]